MCKFFSVFLINPCSTQPNVYTFMNDQELIKKALSLFPASNRPIHFTDHEHCEECKDHDETLLSNTREDISYDV